MTMAGEHVRIRGIVQGVGFRPTVARVARQLGMRGWVKNDADGVLIALFSPPADRDAFLDALLRELPPLARVDAVERSPCDADANDGFVIVQSAGGSANTAVSPDAAVCPACAADVLDPLNHRYRYPFTTCTHCGPRFTIVTGIPWDRPQTTMAGFPMCEQCAAEYHSEVDRRYHAQPVACGVCGPTAELVRTDGAAASYASYSMMDAVDAAATLIHRGEIVAVKGLGGYQLCCDATNPEAVAELRRRKHRPHKPLACMVRDVGTLRRYATLTEAEEAVLTGPEGPIVLLAPDPGIDPDTELAANVAPDQAMVGFMLPTTPLHLLMMRRITKPMVCTSGNLTEEPQCTDDADAAERLGGIADWLLRHDRPIANRVDDSVVRTIDGEVRVLRRARGYAPAPLPLPPGFGGPGDAQVLATGGDLKAVFALSKGGVVVPSQHLGDLDDVRTLESWHATLALVSTLFDHAPTVVAVDAHPSYRSARHGRSLAAARGVPVVEVQHHHAHIASVLAEHGRPREAGPVIGIALDGIGYGEGSDTWGDIWGGEVFVAGYAHAERRAHLKPVALLGGDKASTEPWRNLYAHLRAEMSWAELQMNFAPLPVLDHLDSKPRALLDQMLESGTQAPLASSTGRLFDAVAAALGLHAGGISYEGQAAMALEALVREEHLATVHEELHRGEIYPIGWPTHPVSGLPYLEPVQLWRAILGDLCAGTEPGLIAARFHVALAHALSRFASRLRKEQPELDTVALSGGVLANRVLAEAMAAFLRDAGFVVLLPRTLPPGDGGLAVGQVCVALARS